jgi:ribonucleoside-diphosphate reductase alpha subunit
MKVQTLAGTESVDFNKILEKITNYSQDLDSSIDPAIIAQKTINSMVDGITTEELDTLSAGISANLAYIHPDYSILATRIATSRIHKNLDIPNRTFTDNIEIIYNQKILGKKSTRISDETYDFIMRNKDALNAMINYDRDFSEYDYPAYCSIMKTNVEYVDGKPGESINQMQLRVACGLNNNIDDVKELYEMLSTRHISLSGPVIGNAGSKYNQMASCYLQYVEDSMVGDDYNSTGVVGGILKAVTQLAAQSKGRGGNAVALHDIRASGSPISKINGKSNGVLPFMKMFDSTIYAVNQGGKRAGTCAVYLEPWHADILAFLDAGNHFTIEENRCKNLFFGIWMNDLFMKRLTEDKGDAQWTLFDPGVVLQYIDKPLSEYYGDEFEEKYLWLEEQGIGKTIPLMEIWTRIMNLFQTTGMPYIVNKDEVNKKSNEKNLGTVKSSNLCTEITLVADKNNTGVCVLGSVVLPRFFNPNKPDGVDYDQIIEVARITAKTDNHIIDRQYYATPEAANACVGRRPIGVGMQGLADLFHLLKLEFTSDEAKAINKKVYECLYYGTLRESVELAKQYGPYEGFEGSPASQGILQYNMWGLEEKDLFLGDRWTELKKEIQEHGLRNSEVTALAPTASSSLRMGNAEMHEPYSRNIYVRQHVAGSAQTVNRYLVKELEELNLWNQEMFDKIVYYEGSVQNIDEIPQDIKDRYKTIYEIDWKELVDMNADRAPFISQTASFNHYATYEQSGPTAFTQRVVYAWKKRLKTISYYMHTETASNARQELGGMSVKMSKDTSQSTSPSIDTSGIEKVHVMADGSIYQERNGCGDACQI